MYILKFKKHHCRWYLVLLQQESFSLNFARKATHFLWNFQLKDTPPLFPGDPSSALSHCLHNKPCPSLSVSTQPPTLDSPYPARSEVEAAHLRAGTVVTVGQTPCHTLVCPSPQVPRSLCLPCTFLPASWGLPGSIWSPLTVYLPELLQSECLGPLAHCQMQSWHRNWRW